MGLLYCLGVGCGFVGRVLVWPGGRRGCSEVGGETLVALQVGKGVKTCTSQKRCANIVTTSLRDICYWFNCNCWKTQYSCRFWALECSSIFPENAHGSSRLYVTSHTCALIWSSCYVRAGACHKYKLVHSIRVGWSIHEVRAKQGTRDRSEVGCPARCSATSAAAS